MIRPSLRFLCAHPAHLLALGLGSGLSPLLPGTAGTLFGWLVFLWMQHHWPHDVAAPLFALVIVVAYLLGVWACQRTGEHLGASDHGSMVIDEIVAIWLVLWVLGPVSLTTQIWAFFWFRVFDMSKPPPIRRFERRFKNGWGVMGDDVLAALYTLALFAGWRHLYPS